MVALGLRELHGGRRWRPAHSLFFHPSLMFQTESGKAKFKFFSFRHLCKDKASAVPRRQSVVNHCKTAKRKNIRQEKFPGETPLA